MITSKEVEKFESIYPILESLSKNMASLSSKKPYDVINEFKLNQINSVIGECNSLLKDSRPNKFNQFDKDLLPENSDVCLILDLYVGAMQHYQSRNQETVEVAGWFGNQPTSVWKTKK